MIEKVVSIIYELLGWEVDEQVEPFFWDMGWTHHPSGLGNYFCDE